MKKKLLIAIVFLISLIPINLKAECDYGELVELNKIASHVEYEYKYIEKNNTFSLVFYNIVDEIRLKVGNDMIAIKDKGATVTGFKEGQMITANIDNNSDIDCLTTGSLRVFYITLPYVNPFYQSSDCEGYEEVNICNSKFLNYKATTAIFENILKNYDNRPKDKDKESEEENKTVEDKSFFEPIFNFLKDNYIKILIVIVSSSITLLIFNSIYRKTKHGI